MWRRPTREQQQFSLPPLKHRVFHGSSVAGGATIIGYDPHYKQWDKE